MRAIRERLQVSARDQRALSVGALSIAAVFAAARGVPAIRHWSDASVSSAREVVTETARAEAAVRAADAVQDTMRVRGERFVALAPALLDGASIATAGATLASLISGAAAAADAKLGSVQVRTDTATAPSSGQGRSFARVSVRTSLTADVRGLAKVLLALETGPILLAVDELAVTQPAPDATEAGPELLQIELVVAGLAFVRRDTAR